MHKSAKQKIVLTIAFIVSLLAIWAGYDLKQVRSGIEKPPEAILQNAHHEASKLITPKRIVDYASYQVNVDERTVVSVFARENQSADQNVLLIHGAGGGAWVWEYFFEYLPKEYNLYALSWRGHFDSTTIEDANTIDYLEDQKAVMQFIQQRNSNPIHLIGHSFGGAMAILQTANSTKDIASLILLSPVIPIHYSVIQAYVIPRIAPFFISLTNDIDGVYGGMFLSQSQMRKYHDLYAGKAFSTEKNGLIRNDSISIKWHRKLKQAYTLVKDGGIQTTMVVARYDNVISSQQQQSLAREISADLIVIDGGHYLPLDATVRDVIAEVIKQLQHAH